MDGDKRCGERQEGIEGGRKGLREAEKGGGRQGKVGREVRGMEGGREVCRDVERDGGR